MARTSGAIAVLRIFFGVVYFTNGLSKFLPAIARFPGGYYLIDSDAARSIVQADARHHPVGFYHGLVFDVFVPHWAVFSPLLAIAEMGAGLLLLLGLASGLGALLAGVLALHTQFMDASGPWLFEYAVEWVPLLCLVFMRSGQRWGLDALLADRSPRWKRAFG
jgi:uncharacterized membrane protein YphA (DoxX/SURF4 family)